MQAQNLAINLKLKTQKMMLHQSLVALNKDPISADMVNIKQFKTG